MTNLPLTTVTPELIRLINLPYLTACPNLSSSPPDSKSLQWFTQTHHAIHDCRLFLSKKYSTQWSRENCSQKKIAVNISSLWDRTIWIIQGTFPQHTWSLFLDKLYWIMKINYIQAKYTGTGKLAVWWGRYHSSGPMDQVYLPSDNDKFPPACVFILENWFVASTWSNLAGFSCQNANANTALLTTRWDRRGTQYERLPWSHTPGHTYSGIKWTTPFYRKQ